MVKYSKKAQMWWGRKTLSTQAPSNSFSKQQLELSLFCFTSCFQLRSSLWHFNKWHKVKYVLIYLPELAAFSSQEKTVVYWAEECSKNSHRKAKLWMMSNSQFPCCAAYFYSTFLKQKVVWNNGFKSHLICRNEVCDSWEASTSAVYPVLR